MAARPKLASTPLPWISAVGAAVGGYAVWTTAPERIAALPWLLAVVAAWTGLLALVVLRHPQRQLRMSDSALPVLGWMFYYFIKPMFPWLAGRRFAFEGPATVVLDVDIVTRLQQLHLTFMLSFFAAYYVIAPRVSYARTFAPDADVKPPQVRWLVLLGLSPYISTALERLVTSGTILPTQSYGATAFDNHEAVLASRASGGADYVVTQILAKVWFYPIVALGIGYGVTLARLITARSRAATVALFAQIPALFLLGPGSRSYSVYPFVIALMVADVLAGPFQWRYILALVGVGLPVFEFYGVARSYQDQGVREAIESSQQQLSARGDLVDTEDSGMLVKEAFCVVYGDHTHTALGAEYFLNGVLQLLPMQLVPDKARLWNTANFLGQEFLGSAASRGAGMAGTSIGDGYLIGQEFGVVVLASVFGAIPAVMQRLATLSPPGQGPVLWRYLLVLTFTVHAPQFIRADIGILLNAAIFWVAIPAFVLLAAEQAVMRRGSFWRRQLARVT